ncbi:hypothetical protein GQX73_g10298 [Xylaria multiplex]|uniref:Uncharacterized protein n=1 Tax=Xylaria multiplex TaxID=323545 RepID=A0A7C8IGR8_9PEZI|nr:hypothetical protein GQX73_g10298 [Xylaria multiplex]
MPPYGFHRYEAQPTPPSPRPRPPEADQAVWICDNLDIIFPDVEDYGPDWVPFHLGDIYELQFLQAFNPGEPPGWCLVKTSRDLAASEVLREPDQEPLPYDLPVQVPRAGRGAGYDSKDWGWCDSAGPDCVTWWLRTYTNHRQHAEEVHGIDIRCFIPGCREIFPNYMARDDHVRGVAHAAIWRNEDDGVRQPHDGNNYYGWLTQHARDVVSVALNHAGATRVDHYTVRCQVIHVADRNSRKLLDNGKMLEFREGRCFAWIERNPTSSPGISRAL